MANFHSPRISATRTKVSHFHLRNHSPLLANPFVLSLIRNLLFEIWSLNFASEFSGCVRIRIPIRNCIAATAVHSALETMRTTETRNDPLKNHEILAIEWGIHFSTLISLQTGQEKSFSGPEPETRILRTFTFSARKSGHFLHSLGQFLSTWRPGYFSPFRDDFLLNYTIDLEKTGKIHRRRFKKCSGEGAPKLQISVPCCGQTCTDLLITNQTENPCFDLRTVSLTTWFWPLGTANQAGRAWTINYLVGSTTQM